MTEADDEPVEHWDVQGGSKSGKAKEGQAEGCGCGGRDAAGDVGQIAQGQLAPYEASYSGKLRVGGAFDIAKAIVKLLTRSGSPLCVALLIGGEDHGRDDWERLAGSKWGAHWPGTADKSRLREH